MSSARHRLDVLLKKAKRLRCLDSSACRNVFATTRELIEAERQQDKYAVANLYGNWSLHDKVSRSIIAVRSLAAISKNLLDIRNAKVTIDGFLEYLSNHVFQTEALRSDLLEICRSYGLQDFIFRVDQNWATFTALTFHDLLEKPIQFCPDADQPPSPKDTANLKRAKKIFQKLFDELHGERKQIFRAAWISLAIDPWDDRPMPAQTPVFHCNVQGFDGPTFQIRMTGVMPLPQADYYQLMIV